MSDLLGPDLLGLDLDRDRRPEVPQRRLPWPLDVWLFPFNEAGLTMLAVFLLLPLALNALAWFLYLVGQMAPVLYVLALFLRFMVFFFWAIIGFAYVCYLLQSIQASAEGQIRAPELLSVGQDEDYLGAMGHILRGIGVVAVCVAPASVYFLVTQRPDAVLILLAAGGLYILPMALLSVVMEESLVGLNPVRLLVSLLRTVMPYTPLAIMFVVPLVGMIALLVLGILPWFLALPARFFVMYVQLVMAHLLGWFYYCNEERLDWF
ncbi:MAG TPA: hypothetical protein ENN87_03240 [Phycisphaerales bacterium]|nr:hypothetical protein [Phycisphaerales bacterium]